MIRFYIEARRAQHGRVVELVVYNGLQNEARRGLGLIAFSPEEWEAFRPIISFGMRAAAHAHGSDASAESPKCDAVDLL